MASPLSGMQSTDLLPLLALLSRQSGQGQNPQGQPLPNAAPTFGSPTGGTVAGSSLASAMNNPGQLQQLLASPGNNNSALMTAALISALKSNNQQSNQNGGGGKGGLGSMLGGLGKGGKGTGGAVTGTVPLSALADSGGGDAAMYGASLAGGFF